MLMAASQWQRPVKINLHFRPSLSAEIRVKDTQFLSDYAGQPPEITRHPIALTTELGNFHAVVVNEVYRMNNWKTYAGRMCLCPPPKNNQQ